MNQPSEIKPRFCHECGKQLFPKVYTSGRKENPAKFQMRLYCDNKCNLKSVRRFGFGRG